MHQLIYRIKHNTLYIIIGLVIFAKGLCFHLEPPFWFYPPNFKDLMNSPYFNVIMMFFGTALVVYCFAPYCNRKLTGFLLGVIAGCIAIIIFLELEHSYFAGQFKLNQNVINNIGYLATILWAARHRRKY